MDTDDWSARLREDTTRRLEAVARVQQELVQVHGEATAAHGLVRVRVTPAGRPTALHLAPEATRMPADELASHVMAAIAEAAGVAGQRMRNEVSELMPQADLDALVASVVGASDRAKASATGLLSRCSLRVVPGICPAMLWPARSSASRQV